MAPSLACGAWRITCYSASQPMNSGVSESGLMVGILCTWPSRLSVDRYHGWAASGQDVIYRTDDGGLTWEQAAIP